MITKVCKTCKERKSLKEFRLAPADGRAKIGPPSENCLACHNARKVSHGYGK